MSPHPLGVVGTPRQCLIDIDEAGIWLEKCNRRYGKAYKGVAVREPGKYGHGKKWTIILAIDCQGRRWMRFAKESGTSTAIFDQFCQSIINSLTSPLAPVNPGLQRTFMWDNLSAHHSAQVYNTVTFAGHRVLARPPYRPVDGPIEYIFNQLQLDLTHRIHTIKNEADFIAAVNAIITNLGGFDATFQHCGYQ